MTNTNSIITYKGTMVENLLSQTEFPWEALPLIKQYILDTGSKLPSSEYNQIADDIWIHKTAYIEKSALINGPTIIGANSKIKHCAYLRENVIIGENCLVGTASELKNCILVGDVQVPHYNYVGDSILGPHSHLGAGAITSNFKVDGSNISVNNNGSIIETGLRKFGAMLGDNVEVGCNAVLNPGTIIGKNTKIYPLSNVRGVIEANKIYKNQNEITEIR